MKYLKKILVTASLLAMVTSVNVEGATQSNYAEATLESVGISVHLEGEYMTRGDFSVYIMELSGSQHLATAAQSPFSDVPSTRYDAEAIGVIYQLGILNGCGDGTFAPDRAITLGEAVTGMLRLLSYTAEDIGYRWPEDYILKAQNLGLLDDLPPDATTTFTQDMATQLFYNLLLEETHGGEMFGEQLAASVVRDVVLISNYASNGGAVDQLSVVSNGVTLYYEKDQNFPVSLLGCGRGTLLLDATGKAMGFLPNEETSHNLSLKTVDALGITDKDGTFYAVPTTATLMLGETKTTYGSQYYSLETYTSALLCYGSSGTVELVVASNNLHYTDYVVTGFYEFASPNSYQPETVTVLGATFEVDPEIATLFAQFAYGDHFHLILGENGEVVNVIPYSQDYFRPMIGILGNNSVVTLQNGIEVTGNTTNRMFAEVGQLVKVTPNSLGYMTVAPARATTYDSLNLETMRLGKLNLSENCKFYECMDHGPATELDPSDIYLSEVPSTQIRYYQLDDNGDVEILLFNNATGDQYTYGIINECVIEESTSIGVGNITNVGAYLETVSGNAQSTITQVFKGSGGSVGGMIWADNGTLVSGIILTETPELPRLALTTDSIVSDGIRIPLASDVAVYYTPLGRWIPLADALADCDTFVAHYDKTPEEGGKVRVIFAS